MFFDSLEKTVMIPLYIEDAKVICAHSKQPLHTILKEGAFGEITIHERSVIKQEIIDILNEEKTILFLKSESILYVQIRRDDLEKLDKKIYLHVKDIPSKYNAYVEVILQEDLILNIKGYKKATLKSCKCTIPALGDKEVNSLNHAYTLISEKFEPSRLSRGGNVFKKLFYKDTKKASYLWENCEIAWARKSNVL